MKNDMTFAIEAKKFISSCVNQRLRILELGKSKLHDDGLYNMCKGIETDLQPLYNNYQLAQYLRKKADIILYLIPKPKSKNNNKKNKRLEELNELLFTSKKFLGN